MRKDWEVKKLKEICNIKPPKKEAKDVLNGDKLVSFVPMDTLGIDKMYFTTNQKKTLNSVYSSYTYFKNNDVLLAKITPCFENGKLGIAKCLVNDIGFGSSEYVVYRPNKNLLSQYLYYFLNRPSFRKKGASVMTGAVGHKRIPKDFYEDYKIPVAPLPEQKQIVEILDKAFEAIDKAKANIEKNIENAKELFQSKLNEIFSQKGEGWEEKILTDIITLKSGTTLSKSLEKSKGEIAYLKVADMNIEGNEFEITTSTKFVSKEDIKEQDILPVGTIIFPKRGGAIATNKKRITAIPICVDLNTMGAISSKQIYSEYLHFYFRSFDLMDIANGTTIPQINNYSFASLKISIPNDKS
ncbi:MAG: restriction endonuclease subunit S, partial [Thermodesulfobacteriota bacterium]